MEKEKQKKKVKDVFTGIRQDIFNFIKWTILGITTGTLVGGISSAFAKCMGIATGYREEHQWVFFLLPVIGLLIVFMYEKIGQEDRGTNQVLSTIRSEDEVPMKSAPLIFISTILTHFAGASAGREGAAIQLGGSVGNQLGRWLELDEEDKHTMVMCGMCSAFAAVFGTPMAAAVFAMEIISVGVMYYAALFPCVIAALIASNFSADLGIHPETFIVWGIPEVTMETMLKIGIVSVLCAVASILFCIMLDKITVFYNRYLKNPYIRVVAASFATIGITLMIGTTIYQGSGIHLIGNAVEGGFTETFSFFWKMVLTAIAMRAGFRGGEIVPSFAIGATLGCLLGHILSISPSLCAATGMIALFCGVTNCPLTSALIAFEMFGFEGYAYYVIAVAISYAVSGYYGLYKEQTIVYSKYKAKYINKPTIH